MADSSYYTVNWRETPPVYRFLSKGPSGTFRLSVLEDPSKLRNNLREVARLPVKGCNYGRYFVMGWLWDDRGREVFPKSTSWFKNFAPKLFQHPMRYTLKCGTRVL